MKKILILLVTIMAMNLNAEAQQYEVKYTYDASGNREKRTTKPIKLPIAKSAMQEDPVPVEEVWGEPKIRIFPNPTKGNLKVLIEGGDPEILYQYRVYNNSGTKMLQGSIKANSECLLPMSTFSSGMYYLILSNEGEKLTYKIIKE